MSKRTRGYVVSTIVAIGLLGPSSPRPVSAGVYSDEELGFSMRVPEGWKQIPIAGEEKYIVAKYLCDREYSDKKEGYGHTPDLKVIVLPKGLKKGANVEKDGDTTRITFTNPYKDYADYVKSDNTGGGHFISKEEKIAVNGVDTTWYEVTYEKLTVARRAIAFSYHADDCDYVAQYEVLEQWWEKLSPRLIASLKSFKIFPRKGSVKRETTGGDGTGVTVIDGEKKLTDEEKAKKRQETFERRVRLASERLPDGWKIKRSKNFVAITHVDARFTDVRPRSGRGGARLARRELRLDRHGVRARRRHPHLHGLRRGARVPRHLREERLGQRDHRLEVDRR